MNHIKTNVNRYCQNMGYQIYTINWLEIICETIEDAKHFTRNFYSGSIEKEIHDVFNFRKAKLRNRNYSQEEFLADAKKDLRQALEKLTLSPVKSRDAIYFCEQITMQEFTLEDFYKLQSEKPKLNFFRLFRMINNF
jgi:hypothetical protein